VTADAGVGAARAAAPSGDWLDATRALPAGHPVWPGDAPFVVVPTARIPEGSPVNLSSTAGTTHLGTHVDAPWHYDDQAPRIESIGLDVLIGEGQVVDLSDAEGPIEAAELPDGPYAGRVLLRTGQPDAWTAFPAALRPLTPGAVRRLATGGARLIGTDAPSVDALDSKDLPAHHACGEAGVTIVEGLALGRVPTGRCRVMCLPLRLVGTDAAPARVVVQPLRGA